MLNDKFKNLPSWINLRFTEVTIILAILISGFILFDYERKNHDSDYNKNWVAFYFDNLESPQNGVTAENHTGKDTDFRFCLVPDSNDLMEPGDLSCNLSTVLDSNQNNVFAGKNFNWKFKSPEKTGKYWVVLEYKDGDILKHKDLSFVLK